VDGAFQQCWLVLWGELPARRRRTPSRSRMPDGGPQSADCRVGGEQGGGGRGGREERKGRKGGGLGFRILGKEPPPPAAGAARRRAGGGAAPSARVRARARARGVEGVWGELVGAECV
jgi:hypothetical protein